MPRPYEDDYTQPEPRRHRWHIGSTAVAVWLRLGTGWPCHGPSTGCFWRCADQHVAWDWPYRQLAAREVRYCRCRKRSKRNQRQAS